MHNFKKLNIWLESMNFVKEIYFITRSFPKHELFGLTNQIRRAVVSIPSNIAEGSTKSDKEFSHYLEHAIGSSDEVETQTIISYYLSYISTEDFNKLLLMIQNLEKMIVSFRNRLTKE
jgi:four helix bundle protein